MSLPIKSRDTALEYIRNTAGVKNLPEIKEVVIETQLYSVYLFQAGGSETPPFQAVLVEHLPAAEPAVTLLPIKIAASATKIEKNKKVMDSVHDHFAQAE